MKQDVTLATTVGKKRFPPHEATLIADIVCRDLPYYEAAITPASVAAINKFALDIGVLATDVPYEQIVATQSRDLWERQPLFGGTAHSVE